MSKRTKKANGTPRAGADALAKRRSEMVQELEKERGEAQALEDNLLERVLEGWLVTTEQRNIDLANDRVRTLEKAIALADERAANIKGAVYQAELAAAWVSGRAIWLDGFKKVDEVSDIIYSLADLGDELRESQMALRRLMSGFGKEGMLFSAEINLIGSTELAVRNALKHVESINKGRARYEANYTDARKVGT
jgi:hypothetical protein